MEELQLVKVRIVLSSEYLVSPVWSYEVEDLRERIILAQLGLRKKQPDVEAVNICEMNISKALQQKILAWDDAFQKTFDQNDPKASGFADRDAEESHIKMGQKIADQLRTELPQYYSVEFKA